MKLRHLLAALLPLASLGTAAQAGVLVDVSIVDRDSGATLPLYPARGKEYVAGTPGHRYAVRIVNRTGERVLAVLSVDGVNAISGQTAAPDQSGYVLGPYESTEIAGWRKNMNEIAQFEFTRLRDSYAAQTGRPNNVGVIGVAAYRERYVPPPPPPPPVYRDDKIAAERSAPKSAAAPTAQAPATAGASADMARAEEGARRQRESLGTGHGARESSHASYTTFERDSRHPYEVVSIWYDSYANLASRGIVPRPPRHPREPDPFPNGFTPDPPTHR
ncbi:hypothetical protein [Tahibacter amnicola]|uniref:Uncharacterized protein n=1 Tax=Tahibacter amnicola TaxID=2976241 RepID=A0ABY6BLD0_9GAMM|nr:hypothetical protein [Tahibacter amnicola]UXI69190.1 hypothetical protein N4264_05955 [Tahibacter amnicola]